MKLDDLEKLCDAATDGPWEYTDGGIGIVWGGLDNKRQVCHLVYVVDKERNAKLITAARTEMPKLINVVRLAKEQLAAAEQAMKAHFDGCFVLRCQDCTDFGAYFEKYGDK